MMAYAGKVCVVTGGASGIGRALSLALGAQGACVIVADINEAGAKTTAAEITRAGGKSQAKMLDIASDQVEAFFEDVYREQGRLDYAFNIAGIGVLGEASDLKFEHWQQVIDVNITGMVRCVYAAYKIMLRQKSGHIINMASLAGLVGFPTMTPYAMAKSAVVGLSQSLRHEAAPHGINVSVICPAFIKSAIYTSSPSINVDGDAFWKRLPFPLMDTDKAADTILKSVERNHSFIVFPAYARLLWWLYRINPNLMRLTANTMLDNFRRSRTNTV